MNIWDSDLNDTFGGLFDDDDKDDLDSFDDAFRFDYVTREIDKELFGDDDKDDDDDIFGSDDDDNYDLFGSDDDDDNDEDDDDGWD